jgi:hypothetical protein
MKRIPLFAVLFAALFMAGRAVLATVPTNAGGRDYGSWTALTLGSGVTNVGGGAFNAAGFIDESGFVHLRGKITTVNAFPSTLFTLPVGWRPSATMLFLILTNGSAVGNVTIDSAGVVTQNSSNLTNISIDGITFDTR